MPVSKLHPRWSFSLFLPKATIRKSSPCPLLPSSHKDHQQALEKCKKRHVYIIS